MPVVRRLSAKRTRLIIFLNAFLAVYISQTLNWSCGVPRHRGCGDVTDEPLTCLLLFGGSCCAGNNGRQVVVGGAGLSGRMLVMGRFRLSLGTALTCS